MEVFWCIKFLFYRSEPQHLRCDNDYVCQITYQPTYNCEFQDFSNCPNFCEGIENCPLVYRKSEHFCPKLDCHFEAPLIPRWQKGKKHHAFWKMQIFIFFVFSLFSCCWSNGFGNLYPFDYKYLLDIQKQKVATHGEGLSIC